MEAAAETIRGLRAILPDKPHQLAKTPDWVVNEKDFSTSPNFREEYHISRLGYMTFSSEADRGLLFTRGYDDIRPAKPMPREVNALSRSGATKKLSVNDYLKKKSAASSPDLTPAATPNPMTPEVKKPDKLKPPPTDASSGRLKSAADGKDSVKSTLPLKPPPGLPPKPPTPDDLRKRRAQDDGARAQKRQRPSDIEPAREERSKEDRAKDDRSKDSHTHDKAPKRKQDPTLSRDPNTPKDKEKPNHDQTATLPNGRAALKAATSSRGGSPPLRAANNSNGLTNGSESARGSAAKSDPSKSKSSAAVPQLLSPLRLSFEDGENTTAEATRPEKKRREDNVEVLTRPKKTTEPQPSSKRPTIPQLLSPTLPPEVEAELERVNNSSKDRDHERDRDKDKERKKDASNVARRPAVEETAQSTKPSSLVVTLKIPKNLRQQYRYMMKITRSNAIGPQRAEKRPAISGDPASEATKRPRASSTASKAPVPPSTPSKKVGTGTAMSRVSSNNSMAHTPGDAVAATPNVPDSGDRHPPAELRGRDRARLQLLKEKEAEFRNLGRSLKHKTDAVLQSRREGATSNGTGHGTQRSQSDIKLAWAQILESLLCFVASFHCADVQRQLANKVRDHMSWNSISPLANVLDTELRHNRSQRDAPMVALKNLVQLIANDQLLAAITSHGEPSAESIQKILRYERNRTGLLAQLRKANDAIEISSLRVTVTPWALEDTLADMLRVTRRWCADESVKWTPVLNLKDCGLKE